MRDIAQVCRKGHPQASSYLRSGLDGTHASTSVRRFKIANEMTDFPWRLRVRNEWPTNRMTLHSMKTALNYLGSLGTMANMAMNGRLQLFRRGNLKKSIVTRVFTISELSYCIDGCGASAGST
jgi:hypothetical protein